MDQAERDRLRALIKAKQDELNSKLLGNGATRTPERDAEVRREQNKIASRIRITQTGPDDYAITAVDEVGSVQLPNRLALTRAALMRLPEGCWIASGISNSDGSPVVTAQIGDGESRLALWARMKSAKANGRNFEVVKDEAGLNALLQKLRRIRAEAAHRNGRIS